MRPDLPRSIGFWGGSAIMVGIIIGSGIFRTPTSIAKELGSPTLILALWAVGGVLSLFGALSYAELGTMFPRSGGIYVYMNEGLGPVVSFIFGWTYALITKPLAASAIALVFSEHLLRLVGLQDLKPDEFRQYLTQGITCAIILLLTAVNTTGMRRGAGLAVAFTGLKFMALLGIVLIALAMNTGDSRNFTSLPSHGPLLAGLAPALLAVLWTYDGWSDVASVAGEVRQPQRLLPLILLVGTVATAILFVAVNAVYIWMVPLEEMRHVEAVAPLAMSRLLGPAAEVVVTALIMVSTLGATHSSIITGARVTFAQARDGLLFNFLGRVHPTYQTPDVSLWVQGLLSCVAVIGLKKFEALTEGFVFTMWIFYACAAAAVIVLRIRRPEAPRPYRCWGYPAVPLLFILSAAVVIGLSIHDSPRKTLPWLAALVCGAPTYFIWRYFVKPPPAAASQ